MLKTVRYWMGRGTKTTRSLGAPQSLNPALCISDSLDVMLLKRVEMQLQQNH